MLNFGSTGMTVIMRSFYNAFGSGLVSFLMTWQVSDNTRDAAIVGAITALAALGFRGGIEGGADLMRNAKGDVRPGDVGQR